jgi:D-alanyl-D-alanine carboxypeptidase/D-alanyl-D-alanine-endopeptidase (penicillin-binding protein 4)
MAPGVNARYFHMTNHLNLVPMHDSNQCVFYRQDNDDNVTLSGCLPDRRVWNLGLAIKNPAPFAQGLIHTDLRTHGITLTGQVKMGTLPRGVPVIATHQSVDLWQIINPMLIHSNDIFANAIGKTVGYHTTGVGSFKSAARSIMAVLAKHGVNPREYNLEDAAGLSRYNKVSPKVISQLLFVMAHSKFAHTFEHSLPTTGETGTLTYFDPKLKGVVHAKTGSMTGVFALSGYMTTARHHKVIFSVMLNGILGSERHGHIAVEKVLGGIYRGF